jgi:hypothetical protein
MTEHEEPTLAPSCTYAIQHEKVWLDGCTAYEYIGDQTRFKAMRLIPEAIIEKRKDVHLEALKAKGGKRSGFESIRDHNENVNRNVNRVSKTNQVVWKRAKHGWGRVNGNGILNFASMERFSRNTILADFHKDFDIFNCQGQIILDVATDERTPCESLRYFCENRESILDDEIAATGKTRDDVKKVWTAVFNGGSVPEWFQNPLIYSVRKEVLKIRECIKKANPQLYECMHTKTKTDPTKRKKYGEDMEKMTQASMRSMMSMWFQHYEVKIVSCVLEWCMKEGLLTMEGDKYQGKAMFGYIYDGFVLLDSVVELWVKKVPGRTAESLLEHFHDLVYEKLGFDLVWKIKSFNELYDIREHMITVMNSPATADAVKFTGDMSFCRMAEEFEKKHCKIISGGCYVERVGEEDVVVRTLDKLKMSYGHLWCGYDDKNRKINFIDTWTRNNDELRVYDRMDIYPNTKKCPENVFNLWTPFAMELVEDYEHDEDGLQFFLDFIKYTICGHKQTPEGQPPAPFPQYDYFMKCLGHLVQKPDEKLGKCIILISKQGAGKGMFLKMMKKLLGMSKVFESVNPARDVFGDFNPLMEKATFVSFDEMSNTKISPDAQENFKNFITADIMTIRNLYIAPYPIQSFHVFFVMTNNEDGGLLFKEGDRRLFAMRMNDDKTPGNEGSQVYWNKWLAYLAGNDDIWKTIYEYLMEIDISGDWLNTIPKTAHHLNLENGNKDSLDAWLEEMAASWRADKNEDKKYEEVFDGAIVMANYMSFCERNNFKKPTTNASGLSARIQNHDISKVGGNKGEGFRPTEKKRGSGCNKRVFRYNAMYNYYVEKGVFNESDYNGANDEEEGIKSKKPEPPIQFGIIPNDIRASITAAAVVINKHKKIKMKPKVISEDGVE